MKVDEITVKLTVDMTEFQAALTELRQALGEGLRGVKIVPVGADEPLSPIPDTVDVTEADGERAADQWDQAVADGYVERDFRGLLRSDVVEGGQS